MRPVSDLPEELRHLEASKKQMDDAGCGVGACRENALSVLNGRLARLERQIALSDALHQEHHELISLRDTLPRTMNGPAEAALYRLLGHLPKLP